MISVSLTDFVSPFSGLPTLRSRMIRSSITETEAILLLTLVYLGIVCGVTKDRSDFFVADSDTESAEYNAGVNF